MLKSLFIFLFTANILIVSTQEYEEVVVAEAEAHGSAQVTRSSDSKSDGYSSSSSESSTASAQSSTSTSINTYYIRRCKKNERWVNCPSSLCVPETCDQLGKPIACPRIAPGRCPRKPACVCVNGYVRNKNGICIPKGQCQKCGENQRFVECPDAFCIPSDCVQLGRPILCPIAIPGYCPRKPGCICKEGYVTNGNATCIPIEQCPSCGGDLNAQAGCGFLCGSRCDRNTSAPVPCPCEVNGCQCRSGFTYDPNQKKCVLPCNCKILCPKPNEVFDTCPLPCPPRKCGIDDRAVLCIADQPCQPAGCRCKDGTYKNNDGECVLWENCPPTTEPTDDCDDDDNNTTTQEPTITETPGECPEYLEQEIIEANAKLTGLFVYDSIQRYPGENLIMSAFSLFTPIAQLAYFSQGETLKQFLSVLNLSSKEYIRCVFLPLLKRLDAEENVILNLAVRVFATDAYPLTKKFLDYTRDVFNAIAESLDFSNGEAAAKRINEWAANATNDRIKKIANPEQFSSDTRLVLANAMYFLGNWEHQFNVNNTEDRDFHVSKNKTVKIPIMYQQKTFKYGYSTSLKAKVLEMFYKGGNFSFLAILPDDIEGITDVTQKLQDPSFFYEAYNITSYEKVNVYLPRIKVESEYNLADIMQKAGMTDVFSPAKSNLTDILQVYEPLHISSAKQKAFGLVDEKGTEAAVVNVITVGTTSVQLPTEIYDFNCDHPFVYYILYGRIPIFSGIFAKPSSE